jgi:methionyl-tRNA synthetase
VRATAAKTGAAAAAARLRDVLGDLLEACRLVGLAVAPFMPATAPRVLAQLGYAYPYGPDGNDGPPILEELAWGIHVGETGRVTAPEPLFPRLEADVDAVETNGARSSVG